VETAGLRGGVAGGAGGVSPGTTGEKDAGLAQHWVGPIVPSVKTTLRTVGTVVSTVFLLSDGGEKSDLIVLVYLTGLSFATQALGGSADAVREREIFLPQARVEQTVVPDGCVVL